MAIVSRGFRGRRRRERAEGLPPGQYVTDDFPVFSAGPTPHTPTERWTFAVVARDGRTREWTWDEFQALPSETISTDIHCVTRWSKLGTVWEECRSTGCSTTSTPARRTARLLRWRLHDQPADRGPDRRQGLGRLPVRRPSARARARRAGAAGPASVPVEERQVGARHPPARPGRARLLEQLGYDRGDPWQEQRHWGD